MNYTPPAVNFAQLKILYNFNDKKSIPKINFFSRRTAGTALKRKNLSTVFISPS